MRPPISPSSAMLLLVASMAMTGANVPVAKALLTQLPAEALLLLRFAIATAVLAVLVAFEPGPALSELNAREWAAVAALGLFGSVLFTWAILEGVRRTSGASAGILTATLPAVVALVSMALGERPNRGQLAMIGLAVAGVVLVQAQGATGAPAGRGAAVADVLTGNALICVAVLCEATFVIVARGLSQRLRPLRLSLAVAAISFVLCMPAGIPALIRLAPTTIDGSIWGLFVWYSLTASVLCTALWYRGAAHVEPWAAGLATAALPIAALAVAVLMLGETLSLPQILGASLVLAAILAGTLTQRRTLP